MNQTSHSVTSWERQSRNNVLTLRYLLALGVVYFHAQAWQGNPHFFNYPFVPAFMALSGTLILQSMERSSSLASFALRRIRRIYPALGISFLLAIPLLPSIWPTLVWYLSGGIYGRGEAMYPSWSLMWEQICYALLAALYAVGFYRNRVAVTIVAAFAVGLASLWHPATNGGMRVPTLFACFFVGNLIHLHRIRLAKVPVWIPVMLALSGFFDYHTGGWSVFTSAVGCTVWALRPAELGSWIDAKVGDASVGLYLYHWPILMYLRAMHISAPWDLVLVFPITFAAAFASWHLVEKKVFSLGRTLHVPLSTPIAENTVASVLSADSLT